MTSPFSHSGNRPAVDPASPFHPDSGLDSGIHSPQSEDNPQSPFGTSPVDKPSSTSPFAEKADDKADQSGNGVQKYVLMAGALIIAVLVGYWLTQSNTSIRPAEPVTPVKITEVSASPTAKQSAPPASSTSPVVPMAKESALRTATPKPHSAKSGAAPEKSATSPSREAKTPEKQAESAPRTSEALASPSVAQATKPAMAEDVPKVMTGWHENLKQALAVCEKKNLIERVACAETARWKYCGTLKGERWGSVPECPNYNKNS